MLYFISVYHCHATHPKLNKAKHQGKTEVTICLHKQVGIYAVQTSAQTSQLFNVAFRLVARYHCHILICSGAYGSELCFILSKNISFATVHINVGQPD